MSNPFFDRPILNSPYEYPKKHWELDEAGQPTQRIIEARRGAKFITPIPKPKKRKAAAAQPGFAFGDDQGLSTKKQKYDPNPFIDEVRSRLGSWSSLPNPNQWQVTPETARLLQHWRHHKFSGQRPFFCQIEAVETAIWLTEVAPHSQSGKRLLDYLTAANKDANPQLMRLALKLATGAGKTTVMAMLIAWQTINAVRRDGSKSFTRGFLICAPGLTIKDRLRVLQPNDPDSYYASRELVPGDMLDEVNRAKIVITNYHAFKLRERIELSKGGRQLLQGRGGDELNTLETEGQMIQRVMPDLMGMKNILAINDEAHHCYREKPKDADDEDLKGDERKEAEKNNEAARLWISGLEAVNRKLGLSRIIDLSATPFFLRGSGYAEGTLFPWTMSDFSLMDAIESGIVKLPRVPVAENIPGNEMPMFRDLWENIRKDMPKKGRGQGEELDPLKLPTRLQTALEALYGHYEKTFRLWEEKGIKVPPCFIIVCQNTAISKLVYDFISGFHRKQADGTAKLENGRLALFRNFDETTGNPLPRPNTLLIDSEQLEAGDALDDNFRGMAADEIERFRREIVERSGDARAGDNITDQELLREVMNTVGKHEQLGGAIRCVVSVSMLTEGWDANTVTHVLGIRAFGTQLLCEQVIGRALRRQSYEENEEGLFNVEYADVFGIPFDFTAKPVIAPPQPPRETVQVKAMRPERDALEIRFPRVEGYRVELPEERLIADFNEDSILVLSPDLVGPSIKIPREVDAKWPDAAKKLHADWWQARIARQQEIDKSIAAKAEFEYLYDKPYPDPKKVRVAGPFTVESLSPHRVLGVDENDELIDGLQEDGAEYGAKQSFPQMILENLKTAGVQQAHKEDRIAFTALTPWPGDMVCAEGRYMEGEQEAGSAAGATGTQPREKRAAIFIGPEFGTVQRADLVAAAREAGDAAFDVLIACAFNYEAHTTEFTKLGRIPVLKARMNADLHMAEDLKNTGKGNLFVIFGEPDIDLITEKDGKLRVKVNGVDVFKPQTGEVISDNADGIACWFIDTEYNEESFFVRHAYFLGANDPYSALKTTLKAEIDPEAWATLNSDTSRPFAKPKNGRIAVKVINHLGDEVMKVFRV
jgi:type III restriction enzyme